MLPAISRALLSALLLSGCLVAHAATPDTGRALQRLQATESPVNPRYLLVGPRGQAVSNEDFRGKFQLITFGYTFCPDVCPTTLAEMTEILKQLGESAQQVQAIFVSVDPERDTPQQLATYLGYFDTRILGLSGSPALISKAAQNFHVKYRKVAAGQDRQNYAVDHSAGMYLLGPKGELIEKFSYNHPVAATLDSLRKALQQQTP